MDPATMAALAPLIISLFNPGGSNGERSSTYNSGQKGGINDIMSAIKGMNGFQGTDINQNPMYQQGNEWLMSMFNDPDFFNSFEAPLQRQFQEETIPGLANRFASMGTGGSTGSTAFRNQLGREGSNLHTNIAALRGGMQQQGVNQLMNSAQMPFNNMAQMYGLGLSHPTENVYQPPSNPWAPIAGAGLQGYFQNPNNFQQQTKPPAGTSPLVQ
jgi:hypothetical protein